MEEKQVRIQIEDGQIMKQLIKDVLDDINMQGNSQVNLGSEAARETVSSLISAALKTKGTYHEYTETEVEEQEARATWVCSICGKSTYDVDYDYIGTGTNHLGCELSSKDHNLDKRRTKNWAQKKHEEKVFGDDVNLNKRINQHHELYLKLGPPTNGLEYGSPEDYGEKPFIYVKDKNKVKTRRMTDEEYGYYKTRKFYVESYAMDSNSYDAGVDLKDYDSIQKQAYNEMSSDGLPPGGDAQAVRESHRLAEEIIDNTEGKYIYESPDGGKTIYRRGVGEEERELVEDWESEKKKIEDDANKSIPPHLAHHA